MASMSGFLVPPTVAMPGCSQNLVHAIGSTPSSMSVSVADGTSETGLSAARPYIRSSSWAFFFSNSSAER